MFSIILLANFTSYQKTFVVESGEWAFPSQYICPSHGDLTLLDPSPSHQLPERPAGADRGVLPELTAIYFIALVLQWYLGKGCCFFFLNKNF